MRSFRWRKLPEKYHPYCHLLTPTKESQCLLASLMKLIVIVGRFQIDSFTFLQVDICFPKSVEVVLPARLVLGGYWIFPTHLSQNTSSNKHSCSIQQMIAGSAFPQTNMFLNEGSTTKIGLLGFQGGKTLIQGGFCQQKMGIPKKLIISKVGFLGIPSQNRPTWKSQRLELFSEAEFSLDRFSIKCCRLKGEKRFGICQSQMPHGTGISTWHLP